MTAAAIAITIAGASALGYWSRSWGPKGIAIFIVAAATLAWRMHN
jgi:hypothetical protein